MSSPYVLSDKGADPGHRIGIVCKLPTTGKIPDDRPKDYLTVELGYSETDHPKTYLSWLSFGGGKLRDKVAR